MKFPCIVLLSAVALVSCESENLEETHPTLFCDTTVNFTYVADIKPILQSGCGTGEISCHKEGGLQVNLSDYSETRDAVISGELLGSIQKKPGFVAMPSDGRPFEKCNILKIQAWIEDGYPME